MNKLIEKLRPTNSRRALEHSNLWLESITEDKL